MVLENVASSLLSFFLTKYIDKVSTNDLKMSLFSGTVSLDNLSVKKAALMQHKLPFKIVRGIVNKIYVSIPFIHFKSKPTLAQINNLLVLGKLSDKTINETEQQRSKDTFIPDEFNSIDSALKDQKVSKFDFTTGIIGAIIENLQVKITNIHVRLECEIEGRTVAIGLIVPLIQVMSIDENGKEINTNNSKSTIRKKLILSNLSLYVDTKAEHYKQKMKKENIEFEKLMIDSMNDKSHQFILHNFTFETIYEHAKPGQSQVTIGNILNVTTSKIKLALDSFQYQCFVQIMALKSRYMIKKFYSSCGKPNSFPEKDLNKDCILWWKFVERCSEKKNRPINFNPTSALVFLKNRNKNLEKLSDILIHPNKKKDEKYLKQLQEDYGGDVFLMFRFYAKFITEKRLTEKKHKELEEMKKKNQKEIDKETKEIQELLSQKNNIKNNSDTWYIKYKVSAIDLGLFYTPTDYLAMLQWKAWEGAFKMNKDDIDLETLIGDMNIVNMKSKERTKIIELIKSEKTKGGCATVNLNGNLTSRIFSINSIITSPHLFADLTIINEVKMFLSGSSGIHVEGKVPKEHKRDHTHAEIVNIIDRHPKLFIDLHLDSPIITVPYKLPIQVLLGNVDVKSINPDRKRSFHDKKSWYDEYSLDIKGFQISLGKKQFCEPVTFSLNCLQSFIRKSSMVMTIAKTNISSMDFNMNHKQYKMLLELPDYISQYLEPSEEFEEIKIEHKKDENKKNENKVVKSKKDSIVSDLSIQFNVDFEEFGLKLLKSKDNVGSELKVAGISTGVKALQNKAEGNFVLQYIKILGNKSQYICNFGDEKTPAINIEVNTKGLEIALSMHTSKPNIDIDFDWLGSLLKFVIVPKNHPKTKAIQQHPPDTPPHEKKSKLEKVIGKEKDINQYQLIRKLEWHPIYKIDIIFAGPVINIPCGKSRIIVNLGVFHVYTKDSIPRDPSNIESFYDNFLCQFSKFEIYLGKENLLEPFALDIEVQKAFVLRHDVEALILTTNIHELKLQLKRSQFVSLLSVVDSVKSIIPSNKRKHKDVHDDENKKEKKKDSSSNKNSNNTNIPTSIYVNLKFEALIIKLLNEDNSIHTGFKMTNLESSFNSFQDDINADLKIVVLKGVYNDETLLSFGENDIPSFNFNISNNKDTTDFDLCISKPTVLVDLHWIAQLKKFFYIPNKISSKEMFYEITDSSHDSIKNKVVELSDTQKSETETAKVEKNAKIQEEEEDEKEAEIEEEEDKMESEILEEEKEKEEDEKIEEEEDKNIEFKLDNEKSYSDIDVKKIKDRSISADSFNKMTQKDSEEQNNESSNNKDNDDSGISVQAQSEISGDHNDEKQTEPLTSKFSKIKNLPIGPTLKILAILLPIIIFHNFIFNHKFISLISVAAGSSLYLYYTHKRNKSIQNETNQIEIKEETPQIESKDEISEKQDEETKEESEETSNVKSRSAIFEIDSSDNDQQDSVSEIEPIEEPPEKSLTLLEQLQKVQGRFVVTEPSFTVLLVKKTKDIIKMNAKIKKLNLLIGQDQTGSFNIDGIQISVDQRYLMKPFPINIGLSIKEIISINIDFPAMILQLQTCDYQLLLEIGQYIPAVLHENKKEKQRSITDEDTLNEETTSQNLTSYNSQSQQETQSAQSQQESIESCINEEEETEENKKAKIPFELEAKLNKIELDIFEQKKKLFNFEINSISASATSEGKSDLIISSIICQEHISSENNTIISFLKPTSANLSEIGDLTVSISPDATVFVKMEAVNDLLGIFLPGEQILDYTKPKQESHGKHKHKHKHHHHHKHHHKHHHDDDEKEKKSKSMTISVKSPCFKVIFLDESEIATLTLTKISYEKIESDQAIKIFDIALTDPDTSNLYPSEVLSSEKGKVLSLELQKKDTKIRINRLIVFTNLKVISRVINTVVNNPLKLPPPPEEDEEDESQLQSNNEEATEKSNDENKKDEDTSKKEEKSDNSQIIKSVDLGSSRIDSDTDGPSENLKKNEKKLKLRFKYINLIIPVNFKKSNEMLDVTVDGEFSLSSEMKLSINSISAKFIQFKGLEHPPFIPKISFDFAKKENKMDLSVKQATIGVALDDIAASIVLSNTLLKFISNLNLPQDDGIKKDEKTVKKEKNETDHKQLFSISVEMKKLQLVLNSDRYQTVPLLRFMINQFIVIYTDQKPSNIHLVFDSIDFMDIQNLTWKKLLESISLQISLMITKDLISVDSSVELPININFAYYAIQLILSHIKTVSQNVALKQLIDSPPPTFKIVNNSSKKVSIKRIKTNAILNIDPCTKEECNFTRDEELEIKIEDDSRKIVINELQYPIFVDFQAVSQNLHESGTTLIISSVLLFENQTKFDLYLFHQKTILIHEKLLELPSGKQTPYVDLENLKAMNFVLTTEENSLKSAHSAFTLRDVKRRAILLTCLFPNKKKMKLVVKSKFDPLTCATIVKIQPNCIICNQLPLDLYIRSDEKDEILHIKPGENVKTTIIDTSGLEFNAYFATSSFGENADDLNVTVDDLKHKVNVKTSDGFISSVPLNSISSSQNEKKSKICFAIEAKKYADKPQYDLVCFAPSIIFNCSGIELKCYYKINNKKYITETFSPREKDSDPNKDGCLIWSCEEYFKRKDTSRKLSLQISTTAESERKYCYENVEQSKDSQTKDTETDYMSEDVIECLATHINGPIMIPTKNKDIFVPLQYNVTSAQPYAISTIVTIAPQFAICNNTDKPFYIQPVIIPKPDPEDSKFKKFKLKRKNKNKNNDNDTDNDKDNNQNSQEKGEEIAAEDTETESEKSKSQKKKKDKKFHIKFHKKSHSKTSDETDNETEVEATSGTDEETSTTAEKKKKKKRFHLKSHKEKHAKTDNDNETENATEDETTTANEGKTKKKKSFKLHKIHIKKRKDKTDKKSDDDATSDLESTTTTINDNDDENTDTKENDEDTSTTQNVPTVDPKELEKSFIFGDIIKVNNTGKRQEVRLAAEGLLYAFKVDPKSTKYTLINFSEPIHTTFAHDGNLYEIENQMVGVESLIIIKEAIFPQPINLLNDLRIGSHKIYLTQKAMNKSDVVWKSKASPQSMTIVAYDVPFGGTDLILHYKHHEIPINLIRVNTPKKKHHIYYEVIVNKNNTKTIVVSKIPYEHEKKANVKLHLNIPVISVSLIDKLNREIALLTLQRLDFKLEIGKLNTIMFNMGAFQLDDLQPSSMLKVVVAAYPDVAEGEDIKSKNLLEFSTSMFADTPLFTACKDLSLKCDPIILFVDLSFLSDLITLMQTMFIIKNTKKSVLLSKPKPAESSSLSSIPLTAESITINEIKFTIFVRAKSSRPNLYKPVSYFLRAVPDITNGQIVLPSFHFEDCTMNAAYIEKEIVHPLIDAGIKQGLKLLFNTDIFMRSTGTKSASFAKKGEKLMNGQLQVLVQVPGSMILQGGETGLNVASKFLHNISFSNGAGVNRVNATAKDTMNSGVKALGHGFADAFTGLVKDPMNEKDKKGVGGVFIGLGKGLLGLVTKPIAGILDASVASISAMRKAMNGEDADVIPPLRIAHALPMRELTDYTDQMMVTKDVAQLSFQMSDITVLYCQYVEQYIIDNKTSDWFGMTQEFFFSADKDGTMKKKVKIKNIVDINWNRDTHIITMTVNDIATKLFEIHVNEQDRAVKITEMINSRRLALGIGE